MSEKCEREPLQLPESWDPEAKLCANYTEYGTFHESRQGASLAEALVANGTAQDIALAHEVLEATLICQEMDPRDPHYGNFYWMAEDTVVFDLNAVEFCLEHLIPMMIEHRARLQPSMQARVLEAIRLGLDEIRRLDVLVAYTNITALDILNTCLGGELLGDVEIAQRGYAKLQEFIAFNDQGGIPAEYNSPTYTRVALKSMMGLISLAKDSATRTRAHAQLLRLAVSAGLHLHEGTGRWAAPHSRAYQPSVECREAPEVELFDAWIEKGDLPVWCRALWQGNSVPHEIWESVDSRVGVGLSTCMDKTFALGVGSLGEGGQADSCMVHYRREKPCDGVLYTRYLINDKWLGDTYHPTDRTKSRNLADEGMFYGVQSTNKALGLYRPQHVSECSSAKVALIWTRIEGIDEVQVNGELVTALPYDVPENSVVGIAAGETYMAVRPLSCTAMGRETPVRLVDIKGDLVLEMYNYKGESKRFWELGWPGAFFKGHPTCGFYLEVGNSSDCADLAAFCEIVASGHVTDTIDEPFTYAGDRPRVRTLAYEREGKSFGMKVDVMAWQQLSRWIGDTELGMPMLESPYARQNREGYVAVADASLTCAAAPAWLAAFPEKGIWAAGVHNQTPCELTLETSAGRVHVAQFAMGTIEWVDGQVSINALVAEGIKVTGANLA